MWSIASRASGPARPRWLMQRGCEQPISSDVQVMHNMELWVVEEDGNKMIHHFVASCCHELTMKNFIFSSTGGESPCPSSRKSMTKGVIFVFFENAKKKMKIFFHFFSKKFSSRLSGKRGFLRLTLVLQF